MSTNYYSTFITASPDSKAKKGVIPPKEGSIASLQLAMLLKKPYALTSDDILFEVHATRNQVSPTERARERKKFFEKSHACLRASPLVKQYGWGLHHDEVGKVAVYGIETKAYREFSKRSDLKIVNGMRTSRA